MNTLIQESLSNIHTQSFFKEGNNGDFEVWIWEKFRSIFLPLVGEHFKLLEERGTTYTVLSEDAPDFQIHRRYGGSIIKTPSRIAEEMYRIMNCDRGSEFHDGRANIWYFVRNGYLYSVFCFWATEHGGWHCDCRAKHVDWWAPGLRIFCSRS